MTEGAGKQGFSPSVKNHRFLTVPRQREPYAGDEGFTSSVSFADTFPIKGKAYAGDYGGSKPPPYCVPQIGTGCE